MKNKSLFTEEEMSALLEMPGDSPAKNAILQRNFRFCLSMAMLVICCVSQLVVAQKNDDPLTAKIEVSKPSTDPSRPLPMAQPKRTSDWVAPVTLQLPIHGLIRSGFGPRRDPINGRNRVHQGIDIVARLGAPIQAAGAGTVVFAGRNRGYGNMVMIEHADGRRTLYAHARNLFVKAGTQVAVGQTIAAVGSTGHSTGPHVHFEIRVDNQAVDPLLTMVKDFMFARR